MEVAAHPDDAGANDLKNVPALQGDGIPFLRVVQRRLVDNIQAGASEPDITDAEAGAFRNNPDTAGAGRGAEARILVEQHEVVGGEGFGEDEIRGYAGGHGIYQILQERLGQSYVAQRGGQHGIRTGSDTAANDGNRLKAGAGCGGNGPEKVGKLKAEGFHKTIRGVVRECAYPLENIVHMRLRNAAQTSESPFRKLTCPDPFARDID
jgi:hypothetical protein